MGHIDTDLVGIGEFGIGEFKDMLEVSSVFKPGRSYFLLMPSSDVYIEFTAKIKTFKSLVLNSGSW